MAETLTERIMRHEGLRLRPYLDSRGNWTIGYGQKISQKIALGQYKNGISKPEALGLLSAAIANARRQLASFLPWTSSLSPTRQDIFVEMTYQLGIRGLLGFRDFLLYAHEGDHAAAAREMLDSAWHEQTPARCEELARLWTTEATQQSNGVTPCPTPHAPSTGSSPASPSRPPGAA